MKRITSNEFRKYILCRTHRYGIVQDLLKSYLDRIVGSRHRIPEDDKAMSKIEDVENYMIDHFEKFGWVTFKQKIQYNYFTSIWQREYEDIEGYNIIAKKIGTSSKTLIIAAHHDSVMNSPGADDNATGVALLLYLAEILSQIDLEPTLLLVSFDFEELGLIGSTFFVENIEELVERNNVEGVYVLEMLGYFTETEQQLPKGFDKLYYRPIRQLKTKDILLGNFYAVVFNGQSKKLANRLEIASKLPLAKIRDPVDIPLIGPLIKMAVPMVETMLRSDHTPFWMNKLPAVMVTDTADFRNPHYHTPTDIVETLDLERLEAVAQSLRDTIINWTV